MEKELRKAVGRRPAFGRTPQIEQEFIDIDKGKHLFFLMKKE